MSREWLPFRWSDEGVHLLDQRLLPAREEYLLLETAEEIARAIEDLAVRGAPAIGCAAAMGVARAAVMNRAAAAPKFRRNMEAAFERLARTRPTASNLFQALGRMRAVFEAGNAEGGASPSDQADRLVREALAISQEEIASCLGIGAASLELVGAGARILTHCNAGALATPGCGTALALVRAAADAGLEPRVLAGETRPFLQGARLTAWELALDGIPVTVHTDNMAGHLFQGGEIDLVVVGADRIAANGDVANKIGTYTLAILAREHGVPFYVAAPLTTVDFDTPDGSTIPIEERGRDEVAYLGGVQIVPDSVPVRHPAFDVTPARLVTAIVTERGIARAPYEETLKAL